ncbi:hypothetical protein [Piscinibacter sakaiensis]|uniref:hypothetical protein n=1 Tax=Piscinibacter sakaiensis TaxID=1547922 RepID=UPI003AAE2E0B
MINATFDLFDKLANRRPARLPGRLRLRRLGDAGNATGTDFAPLFDSMLEHVPAHDEPEPATTADSARSTTPRMSACIGIGRVNQAR